MHYIIEMHYIVEMHYNLDKFVFLFVIQIKDYIKITNFWIWIVNLLS